MHKIFDVNFLKQKNNNDFIYLPACLQSSHGSNTMKLEALTDTGCDGLVIHTKFRSLATDIHYSDIQLAFADGSISPTCEKGTFNITITDSAGTKRKSKLEILIANIDYDLILGMRWLAANNCLLDTKNKHVTFREINSTKDSQGENRNKIHRSVQSPNVDSPVKDLNLINWRPHVKIPNTTPNLTVPRNSTVVNLNLTA